MKYILLFLLLFPITVSANYKWYFPRSAVLFSARFVESADYDSTTAMEAFQAFHASDLIWHYPLDPDVLGPYHGRAFSSELIDLVHAENGKAQCALPLLTRDENAACLDSSGDPVPIKPGSGTYYGDTNRTAWRNMISDYIDDSSPCDAYQQDGPWFMAVLQGLGCYSSYPNSTVKGWVHDYYDWLNGEFSVVPMLSYNKVFTSNEGNNSYNELSEHFDIVIGEVDSEQNKPGNLYDVVHVVNNLQLDMTTIATLRSSSKWYNWRFIASMYALGGHPVVPWDVFIPESERYFGDPDDYDYYFEMVREYEGLFDGHGILGVNIQYWGETGQINTGGMTTPQNSNKLVVLKGASSGSRIVHMVNWQSTAQAFWVYVPKSQVPFTPTKVSVYRPGMTTYETVVVSSGSDWRFIAAYVPVWAIAKFRP